MLPLPVRTILTNIGKKEEEENIDATGNALVNFGATHNNLMAVTLGER